ncbi:MAG: 3-methylornithyl-N6-L-lysine dehydrogenase PylD [Deltaproteobacteria bacterium]|nr:3-methylornithyl-N6-L-lysine dehydrogenase PylD [Deltaproteobacteria bacterium]
MTRLKTSDISNIPSCLAAYNEQLLKMTGRSLMGIACHACGKDESKIRHRMESFMIHVVPVTAGQGIIRDFGQIVTAILEFLGFAAIVSDFSDTSGVAKAFEDNADAIMMADDKRFVGLNLKTRLVTDNSEATGRAFAAALDLMAKGVRDIKVLVLGCGQVGGSAAAMLLSSGAELSLYDIQSRAAQGLKKKLSLYPGGDRIIIEEDADTALSNCEYVLEATPCADTISDEQISDHMLIAAAGVPLGISRKGREILKGRLVHDKLELGVAAMAISLFL